MANNAVAEVTEYGEEDLKAEFYQIKHTRENPC